MKQKCTVYGWNKIEESDFYKLSSVDARINKNSNCKRHYPVKTWFRKWDTRSMSYKKR